ncbi:MAG TPA: NUDIX domain-containing protein, partial [Patescibacteria group bacterium]|nr:NUDIX domain-containing protein [Patescibacteria group bacterium]
MDEYAKLTIMEKVDPRLNAIKDCLYRVAIKAVIIRDGKLLVVKENSSRLGLPGGGLEHDELPAPSLARELAEEIGLQPHEFTFEDTPLFVSYGGISGGVPRICVLYRVFLSPTAYPTKKELPFEWLG